MEELLLYLNTIHPMSTGLQEYLSKHLKVKEVPRKGFLLKAGHVCRNIYFIQKGILRCFYVKDTSEVSSWFMTEGNVIISVESFFCQQESYESIQALEDCLLYYIDYNELQYIYQHYPEFNFIARVLTERYYMLSEQRLYSLRMQQAQERYDFLMQNFPELMLRVPAKYLASYLGISEAHFCVIKGKKQFLSKSKFQ